MDRRGKIAAAGIAGGVAGFIFGSGAGIATGGDAYNGAVPFAAIGFALCALAMALVTEPRNREGLVAPAAVGGMNMGKASDMNGKATLRGDIAVSELGTGGKPGDNTIVIAMTRDGARWHDHVFPNWGDFTYSMDCDGDGCSGDVARAGWYADDAGDPSGWVGGVVEDADNVYVGSFVAEKD